MELKELCEKSLKLFSVDSIDKLQDKIFHICLNNQFEFFDKFKNMQTDLSEDLMQKIFQYYFADRKNLSQDYTPKSLSKLISALTPESTILDLCAGSGSLTIQNWVSDNAKTFICYEIDKNVIPYLLFNLMLRNIQGYVINGDVLNDEIFCIYKLEKGTDFSSLTIVNKCDLSVESCISNPPFNMKWHYPDFVQIKPSFVNCELPPKSNANFAFVLIALNQIKKKAAFILPCGVLNTDNWAEKDIIKYLVESNLLDAVVLCPNKMFEKTDISTCILLFNKKKTDTITTFIDYRETYKEEIREQRGQYGGNSHEKRVYTKNIKTFTDEQIQNCKDIIQHRRDISMISSNANIQTIKENDYKLNPAQYIKFKPIEVKTRDYSEIISDLNRVILDKNNCKLIINEKLAKIFGFDLDSFKLESEVDNTVIEKISGQKIVKNDYIRITKNKNEFKFENNSKEKISDVLVMALSMWKQHIHYLNNEETRYLIELRDKLLPDLMSGKISVEDLPF